MQQKFIDQKEYEHNLRPNEELVFSRHTLIRAIALPSRTIFTAMHGNLRMSGAQGTAYIFRADNDALPFNVDEYTFNSDRTGKIELDGPIKPEYHWVPDIPEFIKKQAPQWVKKAVEYAKP